jgi:hypothetical protein
LLSYRSFCCHIMLPIRPVKLQNQDEVLHCTSQDVCLSTVSYVELYQIKTKAHIFVYVDPLLSPNCSRPPQLPCRHCCCRVASTLALGVIIVAAPLVNCCVATALAIVNLGRCCLDLMFPPFGWRPWYDGGRHGP